MTISALRGSGALGVQYATIGVRSTAPTSCWLVGAASVQLMSGGRPLGRPAAVPTGTEPVFDLRPGRSVTARLHGPSTCNAAVSDHVRVALAHAGAGRDFVLPMRGCPLFIDPYRS